VAEGEKCKGRSRLRVVLGGRRYPQRYDNTAELKLSSKGVFKKKINRSARIFEESVPGYNITLPTRSPVQKLFGGRRRKKKRETMLTLRKSALLGGFMNPTRTTSEKRNFRFLTHFKIQGSTDLAAKL